MTSVPPTQPPAAPETDVSRLADWLREQMALGTSGRFILDFGWSPDNLAEEIHAALFADLSAARERVRVVEGERDAARREERMRAEDHARAWREVAAAEARAESAEAAHRALQAIAEDIAYQHAATIDGEYGCCHDEDALRAGGRVSAFDGDEFDPIPDDCPGKQTLDRHLARIAREVR